MTTEHFDVLIVGAGLSGIGAAVHLSKRCPQKSFTILEGRKTLGGTWDLFRYPGVRSDSDMHTLGYVFRPWTKAKAIADGASIREYIDATAHQNQIAQHIKYQHKVKSADWCSQTALWTVKVVVGDAQAHKLITCKFFFFCGGYYNYEKGYTPTFEGIDQFTGRVIHPQQWPAEFDYNNKRVVIIGSGATAITLVPSMSDQASHVTMLQRSPTYLMSRPDEDKLANVLNRYLPIKLAYALTRWKNVFLGHFFYNLSRKNPQRIRKLLLRGVRNALGSNFDIEKDFTPHYQPWDQRLCLIPNADFFKALRSGKASVLTDEITNFTQTGIALKSGKHIDADVIVTATGLDLIALGGIAFTVDGKAVVLNQSLIYKGMMLSDVPNLAFVMGYTNASWTLKADLASEYICRLLNTMTQINAQQCTPRVKDADVVAEDWINFSSGYVQRSLDKFPKQGNKKPWRLNFSYARDILTLRWGKVIDGSMEFSSPESSK